MGKKTFTEAIRENPFILSTLILGLFVLILLVAQFVNINQDVSDAMMGTLEVINAETLCAKTSVTPSWANMTSGEIIGTGLLKFPPANSSQVVDDFISKDIAFIYHPSCSYCQEQIKLFGDDWQKYVDSGHTVDCSLFEK